MLLQSQPRNYNIFFISPDFQKRVNQQLQQLRDDFAAHCNQELARGTITGFTEHDFRQAYTTFAQNQQHLRVFTELDHMFDWQEGEYRLEMKVSTANPDRTFSELWLFQLTAQEIANLRVNCIRICQEGCMASLPSPYHFAYSDYLPSKQQALANAAHA